VGKKSSSGRNTDRPNGKSWKKNHANQTKQVEQLVDINLKKLKPEELRERQ